MVTATFASPALTQNIYDPVAGTLTWDDSAFTSDISGCGDYTWGVEFFNGNPLGVSVYT